jgi:DNA-directed RNA polymerase subunit RPC12/RpoP
MSAGEAALNCPHCGATSVRRSRRANAREVLRMMVGDYPFRCSECGERFWANVWLFNSWRWAKCPRCLNLNLTDWPKRHYRHNSWAQFLATMGAHKHRCSRCRHNFVSFRPRLPAQPVEDPELDDRRTSPDSGRAAEIAMLEHSSDEHSSEL